jgi:tetratricopeptide (TPR) repeat protein
MTHIENQLSDTLSVSRRSSWVWGCVVGFVALGAALIVLPSSPLALVRADFLYGLGHTESALELYDDVAENGLIRTQRLSALRRSAALWSIEMNAPMESSKRWEALAKQSTNSIEQADAWRTVAQILSHDGRHADLAAQAYERSANLYVQDVDAAAQWMHAGTQWKRSGELERAKQIWITVTERYPLQRSDAYVALGRSSLSLGLGEQALSWFDNAVDTSHSAAQRGLAKMGVAISLERLGNLDEAIAELNGSSLPEDVQDVRRRKMLERSENLQVD